MKANEQRELIYEVLKEHDFKLTSPRKVVIDALIQNSAPHYTIEELYDTVQEIDQSIGVATVYRTVNLLYDLKLVAKLDLNDGLDRYELIRGSDHLHHHLVCEKCKKTIEVMSDELDPLEEMIHDVYNFKVTGHNLVFRGICSDCQNRMEKNEEAKESKQK